MKRNVLITGCSSGVGMAVAIAFAKFNFKVYASMRNLEKQGPLQEAIEKENLSIQILQLDVTEQVSVAAAVNEVISADGKIDILINNAGAGFARTTEQSTEEDMKWVTDVNYFGVVRCTKAVLPHMRKAKAGHIINITSVGGLVGQPFNEFYCAAKFAVEGYTEALASYVGSTFGIHFSLIEPGGIKTPFMNSAIGKTMKDGKLCDGEYEDIFNRYLTAAKTRSEADNGAVYQSAEQVATVIVDVANQKDPPLRTRTSEWSENFCSNKTSADPDGKRLLNDVVSRFLS